MRGSSAIESRRARPNGMRTAWGDWSVALNVSDVISIVGAILTLVLLEGLLSADNALVLAVMVRHLSHRLQTRALRYGIVGAFAFRLIAVVFSASLLDYWIFKVVGGFYLVFLAASNLIGDGDHATTEARSRARSSRGFWGTVIAVELADIAFSIDSIVAAVALAEGLPKTLHETKIGFFSIKLWVVYIGGVLGIVMMRVVAGFFIKLLDRFAGLATGAYVLVGWIGFKLIGGGLHNAIHPESPLASPTMRERIPTWVKSIPLEMTDLVFWTGMGVILVVSLLYKSPRRESVGSEHAGSTVEASASVSASIHKDDHG